MAFELTWSPTARLDLWDLLSYISESNRQAAADFGVALFDAVVCLRPSTLELAWNHRTPITPAMSSEDTQIAGSNLSVSARTAPGRLTVQKEWALCLNFELRRLMELSTKPLSRLNRS
jgi:hypothetical protein